jgi:hypothetical protein
MSDLLKTLPAIFEQQAETARHFDDDAALARARAFEQAAEMLREALKANGIYAPKAVTP